MDTGALPPFPLNAWYAAAWDHEVKRDLLPRTICNQKIVFWRRSDGSVAAVEDVCWHRLLPLSLGRLDGDDVVPELAALFEELGGGLLYVVGDERLPAHQVEGDVEIVRFSAPLPNLLDRAVAEFIQDYDDNLRREPTRKTLELVKIGNNWLIVRESSAPAGKK